MCQSFDPWSNVVKWMHLKYIQMMDSIKSLCTTIVAWHVTGKLTYPWHQWSHNYPKCNTDLGLKIQTPTLLFLACPTRFCQNALQPNKFDCQQSVLDRRNFTIDNHLNISSQCWLIKFYHRWKISHEKIKMTPIK